MTNKTGCPLDPLTGKEITYRRIDAVSTTLALFFGFIGAFYCSSRIALRVLVVDIISVVILVLCLLIGIFMNDTAVAAGKTTDPGFIVIGVGALIFLIGVIVGVWMVLKECRRLNAVWSSQVSKKA